MSNELDRLQQENARLIAELDTLRQLLDTSLKGALHIAAVLVEHERRLAQLEAEAERYRGEL